MIENDISASGSNPWLLVVGNMRLSSIYCIELGMGSKGKELLADLRPLKTPHLCIFGFQLLANTFEVKHAELTHFFLRRLFASFDSIIFSGDTTLQKVRYTQTNTYIDK